MTLERLPWNVIQKNILAHIPKDEWNNVAVLNRAFAGRFKVINEACEAAFSRDFPGTYKVLKENGRLNWVKELYELEQAAYEGLTPEQMEFIRAIKKDELHSVIKCINLMNSKASEHQGLDVLVEPRGDFNPALSILEWLHVYGEPNKVEILERIFTDLVLPHVDDLDQSLHDTLLHWAIRTYQPIEVIQELSAKTPDRDLATEFYVAGGAGYTQWMDHLLKMPNPPPVTTEDIISLFRYIDDPERILSLLSRGKSIDADKVLLHACQDGAINTLSALLKNPSFKSKLSEMHLKEACGRGRASVIKLLVDNDVPFVSNEPIEAALLLPAALQELLKHPKAANKISQDKGYSLTGACYSKNAESMRVLIEHGSPLHYMGRLGTPLEIACKEGFISGAKVLLDNTVDPSVCKEFMPLELACQKADARMVALLLKYSPEKQQINSTRNNTPLLTACKHRAEECIKLLLDNGFDPNFHENFIHPCLYKTCFYAFTNKKNKESFLEIARLLVEHPGKIRVDVAAALQYAEEKLRNSQSDNARQLNQAIVNEIKFIIAEQKMLHGDHPENPPLVKEVMARHLMQLKDKISMRT